MDKLKEDNMKVICISGKAQHGKDTTANIIKEKLTHCNYQARVLIVHYADLLKYICKSYFGWNGKKDEYGRQLLQHVGTDIIRKQKPSFWVDFVVNILQFFKDEWDYVIIPDCRFPNEISTIVDNGFDTIHIRVVRDGYVGALTEEQKQHLSETALDDIKPDYYIANNETLADLHSTIHEWMEEAHLYEL